MSSNLMSFEYQIQSEGMTERITDQRLHGWLTKYPDLLDALFECAYYTGVPDIIESPEGFFHSFAHNILLRFPYTVRATCLLIEKGFYFESVSLLRNLYEALFQLRYFNNHKDLLRLHVVERRVKFKVMFEEVAPGFYKTHYIRDLSEFAHNGFGSALFRVNYTSPTNGTTTMGSEFNEDNCSYASNQLVVLVFGMLNWIPEYFSNFSRTVPASTESKRKQALSWLQESMTQHMAMKIISKRYYNIIYPLIMK